MSSFLLFWNEFIVSKQVLPLLGGSPGVWSSCLVFYSLTLLVGYGWGIWFTNLFTLRQQVVIHTGLSLMGLLFLPIESITSIDQSTLIWLWGWLISQVGYPFLIISITNPLLQKWFSLTGQDPYLLYAASNFGSLVGVLGYPLVIEPLLSLAQQKIIWTMGYGILTILILIAGLFLNKPIAILHDLNNAPRILLRQKIQWVFLSFIPASLLLGITTYLSTDLASFPLLWAIPLSLYLMSFILVFAQPGINPPNLIVGLSPILISLVILLSLLHVLQPISMILPLHCLTFLVIAWICHGELVKTRPDPLLLTSFYFYMALGGLLGAIFSGVLAPILFSTILEYPLILTITLIILGIPSWGEFEEKQQAKKNKQELIKNYLLSNQPIEPSLLIYNPPKTLLLYTLPICLGLLIGTLIVGLKLIELPQNLPSILLSFSIMLAIGYSFPINQFRLGLGMVLMILLIQFYLPTLGKVLFSDRSFFGINRVIYNQETNSHDLIHGTTLHGKQSIDPEYSQTPLTYFYPTGPIGQVFEKFKFNNIGVMGLGVGTLAAYAEPWQKWLFYELDPLVKEIALNPKYFTYLKNKPFPIILGDARQSLLKTPDQTFDLLIMDAFSSDSIPVHLITLEAIQLYFQKLKLHGLLMINISNRYLNIEPLIGGLAAKLNLVTRKQLDLEIAPSERLLGKAISHWVIVGRDLEDLTPILGDSRWTQLSNSGIIWTDDFSALYSLLKWW